MAEEEIKKTEEQVIASDVKTPEVIKESLSDSKVTDVKSEVKVETEIKTETKEEIKSEPTKETLKEEIKKTAGELDMLGTMRDELVTVYSKNKELEAQKEQLSKKVGELESENVKIKEQLNKYVENEKTEIANRRAEKLSALSEKFKLLGQEKTVEQLSAKDDATIDEFEKIVDAALEKTKNKEAPAVTVNSQSAEKKEQLSSESKIIVKPTIKKQTNEDFFKNICSKLTKEQLGACPRNKSLTL